MTNNDEIISVHMEPDGITIFTPVAFSFKKEYEDKFLEWNFSDTKDTTLNWTHVHNPYGPAWLFLNNTSHMYYLNGVEVNRKKQEEYLKQIQFKIEFNEFING